MPPKGKDLSRMVVAPPVATSASMSSDATPVTSGGGSKPKGKDFSRMGGPPQHEKTTHQPQIMTEEARRWNDARAAAGMPPVMHQQQMHQTIYPNQPSIALYNQQQQQQQSMQMQQPLMNPAVLKQPTKRPGWSDARLSTMNVETSGATAATAAAKGSSGSTTTSSPKKKSADDVVGRPLLAPILGEKLQTLCHSIDPSYTLDAEVQERLVEMADAFVEKVTRDSIKLARHRGSSTMDVVDVALALKKGYNMSVPNLGPPSVADGGETAGWQFAEKINLGGGSKPPATKKRKTSAKAAAAALM